GGLLSYLAWVIEQDSPLYLRHLISYLFQMLKAIAVWDAGQAINTSVPHSAENAPPSTDNLKG
ncbi:MAG: hypothetical protein FWG37_05120, partial [Clostridia bacterium]|nr:hypothetical protein [Clostridia bacterium]